MSCRIQLQKVYAGYAARSVRSGDEVPVQSMEFTSTEDGQHMIKRLEGIPTAILNAVPDQIRLTPSQVDTLLAVIGKDRTATVYLNEIHQLVKVRINRSVERGEAIFKDDIVDIVGASLHGISIPKDAGVVFVFSIGWRRGLFYDLGPLAPQPVYARPADLEALFGSFYAHLMFQERFAITEAEWSLFFAQKWFPFAALRNEIIDQMLNNIRSGWHLDDLLDPIAAYVKQQSHDWLASWGRHAAFTPHMPLFEQAVERLDASDYLSATALIYPRIEGLMRSHSNLIGATSRPSQSELANSSAQSQLTSERCLLLPRLFEQYLREVYFASFDPTQVSIPVSRNSVGHGVASANDYSLKSVVIGFLIIHQLFYCFVPHNDQDDDSTTSSAPN